MGLLSLSAAARRRHALVALHNKSPCAVKLAWRSQRRMGSTAFFCGRRAGIGRFVSAIWRGIGATWIAFQRVE